MCHSRVRRESTPPDGHGEKRDYCEALAGSTAPFAHEAAAWYTVAVDRPRPMPKSYPLNRPFPDRTHIMPTRSAIVAGHICLDIILTFGATPGHGGPVVEPGKLVNVGPPNLSTGGAVPNTGLALHRLGIPTRLMGKIGDDLFGTAILDLIERRDPALAKGMIVSADSPSSYTVVLSPPGVDRSFLHCTGANDTFGPEDVDPKQLRGADLFHFGYPAAHAPDAHRRRSRTDHGDAARQGSRACHLARHRACGRRRARGPSELARFARSCDAVCGLLPAQPRRGAVYARPGALRGDCEPRRGQQSGRRRRDRHAGGPGRATHGNGCGGRRTQVGRSGLLSPHHRTTPSGWPRWASWTWTTPGAVAKCLRRRFR